MMSLMYVWCRKINDALIIIFIVLPIKPVYYFWIILFIRYVLNFSDPRSDFLSVISGHLFYFMTEVYPSLPLINS